MDGEEVSAPPNMSKSPQFGKSVKFEIDGIVGTLRIGIFIRDEETALASTGP